MVLAWRNECTCELKLPRKTENVGGKVNYFERFETILNELNVLGQKKACTFHTV